jgi:hypothetical protein
MVNVLSKLNIKANSAIVFQSSGSYPVNPQIGQLAFIDNVLLIYSDLDDPGNPSWHPLINADVPTYTHTQGLDSLLWTINHGLNSDNLIFFVYDNTNTVVFPSSINFVDNDTFTLEFQEAIRGRAVVFSTDLQTSAVPSNNVFPYEIENISTPSFTPITNRVYAIDTTLNPIDLNLPTNPQTGDWIGIVDDKANFATNNLTLKYNSIHNIQYDPSDFILDANKLNIKLMFINNNWVIFD